MVRWTTSRFVTTIYNSYQKKSKRDKKDSKYFFIDKMARIAEDLAAGRRTKKINLIIIKNKKT